MVNVAYPQIYVDWNNDGDFGDTGEEVTGRVLQRAALHCVRGKDISRALNPPMAGSADGELNNASKDYSYEYDASPLAGNLLSGRPVKWTWPALTVAYNEPGLPYNSPLVPYNGAVSAIERWRGILDDIPQHPEPSRRSVNIPSLGTMSRLKSVLEGQTGDAGISTALYSSIRTDVALGHILDAIGWGAGASYRTLDTGKTTFTWWWLNNQDPWEAMIEILNSEGPGASIYEDGEGRFVFESRHYRSLTARCVTSRATFRATGSVEPLFASPASYDPRRKDVVNSVALPARIRTAKSAAVVWTGPASLTIPASSSIAVVAESDDPFQSATTPVAATDYTVSAGSITSVTLNRTSGQRVTITYTAGPAGATITGLQLRAAPVTTDSVTIVPHTVDTTTSVARYGTRAWAGKLREEITRNDLADLANGIVSSYQYERPRIVFSVPHRHLAQKIASQQLEISDRITVVDAQTGIDDDFHIERLGDTVHRGVTVTTFGAEKVVTQAQMLILDHATYGKLDSNVWGW